MTRGGLRVLLLLLLPLAAACTDTRQVALSLEFDEECTEAHFEAVQSLSVQLYGLDNQGQECWLQDVCVGSAEAFMSSDDVTAALRGAQQPIIDYEADDARRVAVVGHAIGCPGTDDLVLCGSGDLSQTRDGTLEIVIGCDDDCPEPDYAFCR